MAKSFKSHLVIPSITSLLRAVCWNYITSSSKSSPPQIGSAARLPVQLGHREIDNPQICQYTISSIEQKHAKMCAMITHSPGGRAIFQHSNTQIPHAQQMFCKNENVVFELKDVVVFSKSLFHLSFEPACRSSSFSGGIMQKRTREAKQDMCWSCKKDAWSEARHVLIMQRVASKTCESYYPTPAHPTPLPTWECKEEVCSAARTVWAMQRRRA